MPKLIEIQIASDWTGERKLRVMDRLLPIVLYDGPKDDSPDPIFKIFKSSYDSRTLNHYYGEREYRYHLPSGSLLHEKFHGKSLLRRRWHKFPELSSLQKQGIKWILTTKVGIGKKMAEVITSRPYIHYLRIEEFISGFVDSLWLADELVFLEGSSDRMIVKQTLRKIFHVGAFNLNKLVDDWKEFGNYCFHSLAKTQLIGGELSLSRNNMFRTMLGLNFIRKVFNGDYSHRTMQNIAHLMSSRQMPYMGQKTEEKARETFKQVLQSDYRPKQELVDKMGKTAYRIGRMCKRLSPGPIPAGTLHFSVTCSGELDHTFKKGAQASAVKEAFLEVMSEIPDHDFDEQTPFGLCIHRQGIPLWRTAFRPEKLNLDRGLLETYKLIEGEPDRVAGLDEYAGIQIMYVAWKKRTGLPVVRSEVVPEMGNKARHVTVSAWWLGVLQAPLAHALIEAMKWHPSCFSSFHREDQAWEAAKQLARTDRPLAANEYVLSSDLKDATNAQQWELTKTMLLAFSQGYGFKSSEYLLEAIGSIGPRLVLFKDDTSVLSNVGIMMGEPLAKPSLTLLNLCIEELSFLEYTQATTLLEPERCDEPDPHKDWRHFIIGGDDHLAQGPLKYLKRITQLHLECGSHIDPGKHGYSRRCVKFTERVLNIENLKREHPKDVDHNDYCRSLMVDSVKVRLLERGLSTERKKDNKNVAIGKSKQLGNTISWLPDDSRLFTHDKKVSIRKLFIKRMGGLLPRENQHPRAFAQIHLPDILGGYGLGMKSEFKEFLLKSPEPVRYLLCKKLSFSEMGFEQDLAPDVKIFRKLNSNTSVRGSESVHEYMESKIERTNLSVWNNAFFDPEYGYGSSYSEIPPYAKFASWKGIKAVYYRRGDNAKKIKDRASIDGWIPVDEYANRCARGLLFQTLITGTEELKIFNTVPYVQTYKSQIWPWYEREGGASWDLSILETRSNDELYDLLGELRSLWYINTKLKTTTRLVRRDAVCGNDTPIVVSELLDGESVGLPSLKIKDDFLQIFNWRK